MTEWLSGSHRFITSDLESERVSEGGKGKDCTDLPEIGNGVGQRSLRGNVGWLARVMIELLMRQTAESPQVCVGYETNK